MLFRLHGLVVAALGVALAAPPARADGLCIEDTQVEPDLGRTLDRLVATAKVTVRSPGQCVAAGAPLVGRFSRLDPVLFTLHTPSGEKFSRAVPWLTRPDAALVRLRAQGRMSAFSVLVEGLLAEQRISAAREQRAPPSARAPASREPAPSARPVSVRDLGRAQSRTGAAPRPEQPAAASRSGDGPAPARPEQPLADAIDSAPAEPAAAQPAAAEPAAAPAGETAGVEPAADAPAAEPPSPAGQAMTAVTESAATTVPGERAATESAATSVPGERAAAESAATTVPGERAAAESAATTVPGERAVTVRLSGQDAAERAERAGSDPPRAVTAVQVQESPGIRTWPAPEALLAARMRSPEMAGIEVGAGVAWRSLFARVSYQAPVRWDLEGRPIDVSGTAFSVGYRPATYRRGAWRFGPTLATTLERVAVQRADLQDAAVHPYWDPGVAVGGAISRDIAGALRVTLHVEACRMFGRTVRVPDGPEASFNRLGARAALSLAWLP